MMSSETSTETFQPWQLFTLAGLIGATVVVFVSQGQTPAGVILLSLTIFAAALVGFAAWRTFAPLAGGEEGSGPQILGGRTRAALEREKALVLRALKDLEFDRAMGKMSEKDFAEITARMRVRAAGLLRQLDAGTGYRDQIEREIAKRIGADARHERSDPGSRIPDPVPVAACPSCHTRNDADARFCKHCGAALSTPNSATPNSQLRSPSTRRLMRSQRPCGRPPPSPPRRRAAPSRQTACSSSATAAPPPRCAL